MHDRPFRHTFKAMGSPCELHLYTADAALARRAHIEVTRDLERLEQRYSRYRDTSLLSQINRVAARGGNVEVDDETARLLTYAATCFAASDGLFDITSGILRKVWKFSSGALPERESVEALLPRVGWDKVHWNPPQLSFPVAGVELAIFDQAEHRRDVAPGAEPGVVECGTGRAAAVDTRSPRSLIRCGGTGPH